MLGRDPGGTRYPTSRHLIFRIHVVIRSTTFDLPYSHRYPINEICCAVIPWVHDSPILGVVRTTPASAGASVHVHRKNRYTFLSRVVVMGPRVLMKSSAGSRCDAEPMAAHATTANKFEPRKSGYNEWLFIFEFVLIPMITLGCTSRSNQFW